MKKRDTTWINSLAAPLCLCVQKSPRMFLQTWLRLFSSEQNAEIASQQVVTQSQVCGGCHCHNAEGQSVSTTYSLIAALLLSVAANAHAKHVEGEETNVVMFTCVIDTSKKPLGLYVEALSTNTTTHPIPLIRVGESCAQALQEFMTAGFALVNQWTATDQFVLVRKDRADRPH